MHLYFSQVNQAEDGFHYFLHYLGWNVRWDKWSMEDELMPDSAEAEAMQKELKTSANAEKDAVTTKKRKSSGSAAADGAEGEKKKKRAPTLRANTEDDSGHNFPVKLTMPLTLKRQLVKMHHVKLARLLSSRCGQGTLKQTGNTNHPLNSPLWHS